MVRDKSEPLVIQNILESRESFSCLLKFHHTTINDKIDALRVINDISHRALEEHLESLKQKMQFKINGLSREAKSEYDAYSMNILDLSFPKSGIDKVSVNHPKTKQIILKETEMHNHREYIRRSSNEMALVYLVIIFEEFISNTLIALFTKMPEILETEKNITYKEALKCQSISDLLKVISRKEVDSIISNGIDSLQKYLCKKFGLNLKQRKDWEKFRELFYRRNIVVHNYGFPNSIYTSKTHFNGNMNEWLEIDVKYLMRAFNIMKAYSNKIAAYFQKYSDRSFVHKTN